MRHILESAGRLPSAALETKSNRGPLADFPTCLGCIASLSSNHASVINAKPARDGEHYELSRSKLLRLKGGAVSVRTGLSSGIDVGDTQGVNALSEFVKVEAPPRIATGYRLASSPACNSTALANRPQESVG